MTSVTLPAGVTEIGERSFYNISALTEFNFSESSRPSAILPSMAAES